MAMAIERGASGAAVKNIQKMMNKSGAFKSKLKEDGEFEAKTEVAVKEFQKQNQMQQTGSVDGLMLKALMAMAKAGKRDLKDAKGIKLRKLNDKQQQKADALQGKTTETKAMRDNANKLERYFDEYERYIQAMEKQLASVGDDAQLANIDLQNALQKQQQTLQTMSNVSKMLHDTAMSIIRKIG